MQRFKCIISYDGTNFSGYQIQPGARTVQKEIEDVLSRMHKDMHIRITASGRTDAGVHANGQVIHFDSPMEITPENMKRALNALLPHDIVVHEVTTVNQDFHARFSVLRKEYRYKIYIAKDRDVFTRSYMHHIPYELNFDSMQQAMKDIIGTHDFTSFCSAKTAVEDKVRTIYEASLIPTDYGCMLRFVGNGFLYNMVRILTGTLIEIGSGKIDPYEMTNMLNKQDRTLAGKTAPAHGLYLWHVEYNN
ncbi:tRNA pseudouridine(38-40) synthase TruA [Bacillus sp. HMF5848]|uniref:tRNA pseudouridine(38-40) synthase TruA n=1 Tax=Bacillus sp. HMF5848 TaxID=2495421 RepID=UPI000F7B541A|nr:tRNA pseudouridine(38-40) synthase TruA [Bacillus sp. HMF5848]RSK25579.1 tRNA pseudouridine(38-40) synthase TruA [Bacillus sp. HMF5848]